VDAALTLQNSCLACLKEIVHAPTLSAQYCVYWVQKSACRLTGNCSGRWKKITLHYYDNTKQDDTTLHYLKNISVLINLRVLHSLTLISDLIRSSEIAKATPVEPTRSKQRLVLLCSVSFNFVSFCNVLSTATTIEGTNKFRILSIERVVS
jgi:hypothetical protein